MLIFVMEPEPELATHTRLPSGLTLTATGLAPTLMVANTVLVAVAMTETVPAVLLAT